MGHANQLTSNARLKKVKKTETLKLVSSDPQFIIGLFSSLFALSFCTLLIIGAYEEYPQMFNGDLFIGITFFFALLFLIVFVAGLQLYRPNGISFCEGVAAFGGLSFLTMVSFVILSHYIRFIPLLVLYLVIVFFFKMISTSCLGLANQIEGRRLDENKYLLLILGPMWMVLIGLSVFLVLDKPKFIVEISLCLIFALIVSMQSAKSVPDLQTEF